MKIDGFTAERDENGNVMLNEDGHPIFKDALGNKMVVKLDKSGKPMVDSSGMPVFVDVKGNVIKATVDKNGRMVINNNPIGIAGFMQKLDDNGNPVLNEKG